MDEHTLRVLEFDKILARLARLASFSAGRELALALRPSPHREEVIRRQRITSEARRLLELQPRIGLGGVHDVRPQADKAARAGVLQPGELLDIASTLTAAGDLRTTVGRFRDDLPLLGALTHDFEPLPELVAELNRSIDQRTEVTDAASPALGVIRREVRTAHNRLNDRLQQILASPTYREAIQEPLVTLRDGRYVIPVKADQRGKIRGVVHDTSASGATVFLEPLVVVELGNAWRELQLDEQREVERILRELSGLVGESADAIIDTVAALAEFDLALAKGRLADELDAPELPHEGDDQPWIVEPTVPLHLLNARHPLLTGEVVPITITVGDGNTVLLITGPNTGGKTVALKTAGLLSVMAQAGLPVPADAASRAPIFGSVHADIGDEQSIEQSLSTFSSHMTNIIRILRSARRESLVLLDELAAGTDPVEGSALARAILDRLLEVGCLTVATTHHGELKAFAHTTDGIQNASVEFDPETLMPTFHLTIGLPGRSNAIAIAERLGLPKKLLQAARDAVAPDQAQVDSLLSDIRRERDEAAAERLAQQRVREEAEESRARMEEHLAEREEQLDATIEKTAAELEAEAKAVRERLEEAEREAKREKPSRAAERLAQGLERLKELEARRVPKPRRRKKPVPAGGPPPEQIQAGDLVWVRGYDRYGEAVAPPDDRGEVELHLGPLRATVQLEQVERVQRPKQKGGPATPPAPTSTIPPPEPPPPELDLRGQTVDEALPQIDQYLDQAYRAAVPWVRIVHGKGTGTLRRQVRDFVRKHPLVLSYETGQREEGGEGVTVVHLAE